MRVSSSQLVSNAAASQSGRRQERLLSVCKEFEEVFHRMLLRSMRSTVPKEGLMPSSPARNIYESLLDAEYAKVSAESGGLGIAEMLYEFFLPAVPASEEDNGEAATKT